MPQPIKWYPVVNTKGIIKKIVVHHGEEKYLVESKEEMLGFLRGYGYVPNSFNRVGVDMLLNNKDKSKPSGLLHSMNGSLYEINKASIRLIPRMHLSNGVLNINVETHLFEEEGLRKNLADFVIPLETYGLISLMMTGEINIDLARVQLTSTGMNRVKSLV